MGGGSLPAGPSARALPRSITPLSRASEASTFYLVAVLEWLVLLGTIFHFWSELVQARAGLAAFLRAGCQTRRALQIRQSGWSYLSSPFNIADIVIVGVRATRCGGVV